MTATATAVAADAGAAGTEPGGRLGEFLTFSAEVTGFKEFDLFGTGQAQSYLDTVVAVVGDDVLDELLNTYRRLLAEDPVGEDSADEDSAGESLAGEDAEHVRARQLNREIFSDEQLGPIARNIIKLWYVGVWYELPPQWSDRFGARENDGTFTASAQAYAEGLLWYAIGANPPGARAPGYGSWVGPPRIPAI
jgi:hypothetical protein